MARRQKKSTSFFPQLLRYLALPLLLLVRGLQLLARGATKPFQRFLRQRRSSRQWRQAGFVLPTIVMVGLVVTLVAAAVLTRSFDRSKNAANFRVNEAVLNAATPSLDRARAKIARLLSQDETNLPVGTPSDEDIKRVLDPDPNAFPDNYTFGDEQRIEVSFGGNKIRSAWRYPVDSDNNGKLDSFNLYGIYYSSPPIDPATNKPSRPRTPLDARSEPMGDGQSQGCSAGGKNEGGWVKTGSGALKKAFFTYVATVPISQAQATALGADYEAYKGQQGFAALEMQQDQSRISLDNNAVFYNDDLEITFAPKFFINGRVHTNGNLLVSAEPNQELVFLQVSSPVSCYYRPENSQISVGGNVASGGIYDAQDTNQEKGVRVHLFRGRGEEEKNNPTKNIGTDNPDIPSINGSNKTTFEQGGRTVAYNDAAFQERLRVLTFGALAIYPGDAATAKPTDVEAVGRYPREVKDAFAQKYNPDVPDPNLLSKVLKTYFEQRVRRVPYKEAPLNQPQNYAKVGGSIASSNPSENRPGYQFIFNASPDVNGVISAPKAWMLIEDPTTGSTNGYTNLPLQYLPATDPQAIDPVTKAENYLGDRVLVGNSLPYQWFNGSSQPSQPKPAVEPNKFAKPQQERNIVPLQKWKAKPAEGSPNTDPGETGSNRTRRSRIVILDDIADTSRAGFWENAAASRDDESEQGKKLKESDPSASTLRGGLRIVTGAGIYVDGCPTDRTSLPTGFTVPDYCGSTNGLGMRTDSGANDINVRSFLPTPPQFQADPNDAFVFRLSLSPPHTPDPTTPPATPPPTPTPAPPVGEQRVKVRLPGAALLTGERPITVWPDSMPMWEDRNLDGKWDISGWHKAAIAETDIKNAQGAYLLDLKGDLQMRSTVVYHYASATPDLPIACFSSYYDPSNKYSANASDGWAATENRRNPSATPVGGVATATNGRSYAFNPSWRNPSGTDLAILQRQAAMVFPDGRLVNEPLRNALQKPSSNWSVADKAAIDSAMCSLKILDGSASPSTGTIPNGAIRERTMVDARQIKAVHKLATGTGADRLSTAGGLGNGVADMSNPDRLKIAINYNELTLTDTPSGSNATDLYKDGPMPYNLPLEQRQPMEIRITEIDLDVLRKTKIGSGEYLIPNSGIIYATRDDALPDLSAVDESQPSTADGYRTNAAVKASGVDTTSATDFKLDPTRHPHGIRLINGSNLSRESRFRNEEKGLILASNVPVYIKADRNNAFNLHAIPGTTNQIEEFTELVNIGGDVDGGNFYNRKDFNLNFACRQGSSSSCSQGDQWRAARVIADSITFLSQSFYDGVRTDSDFDTNNNGGNHIVETRLKSGFWWNGFGTSAAGLADASGNYGSSYADSPADKQSSYWTNGVTPIQRRVGSGVPVYQMEICLKLPVAACKPEDWKREHLVTVGSTNLTIKAGTTGSPATVSPATPERTASVVRLPRRVAFERNSDGSLLVKDATNNSFIIGTKIGASGTEQAVAIANTGAAGQEKGRIISGTLPPSVTPAPLVAPAGSATGPILWFAGGAQQPISVTGPTGGNPATLAAGAVGGDPDANSPSTPYFQEYIPKKTGLPRFLTPTPTNATGTPVNEFPGLPAITGSTLNQYIPAPPIPTLPASAYLACIGTPPNPASDPVPPGSGASTQLVIRTESGLGLNQKPYSPPPANSTIPIAKPTDPVPPIAIAPFQPYLETPAPAVLSSPDWVAKGQATTNNDVQPCQQITANAIENVRTQLVDNSTRPADIIFTDFAVAPGGPAAANAKVIQPTASTPLQITVTAVPAASAGQRKITYIDLGNASTGLIIPNGTKLTLQKGTDANADPDPIFVIRGLSKDGIVFGDPTKTTNNPGVQMTLKDVNPNNVFWVSKRGIYFSDVENTPAPTPAVPNPPYLGHLLMGNFIGRNTPQDPVPPGDSAGSLLYVGNNTKITAGRFLGFTGSNLRQARPAGAPGSDPSNKSMEIWAMNSMPSGYEKLTSQPLMVPVLNIHSPNGSPGSAFGTNNNALHQAGWIPTAQDSSTFNAVMVMGDSPARPIERILNGDFDNAESNGGLVNFPRFLEVWEDKTVKISGGLIQFKKSNYASGSFESIENPDRDNSLFYDTPVWTNSFRSEFKGFRYPGGGSLNKAAYYRPPIRQWGYDVGLLSQSPDLFSQRFALPATALPSEYFREVGRDDLWVRTLLCATLPGTTTPAIDPSQRPSKCD